MFRVRYYKLSDYSSFQELYLLSLGNQPELREHWLRTLEIRMAKPGYNPEKNLILVQKEENLVGFLDCIPEDSIERIILTGYIRKEFRRKGIAGAMLEYAEKSAIASGRDIFHVCLDENNPSGVAFLKKNHFKQVRIHLDLVLNLKESEAQLTAGPELDLKNLRRGGEFLLAEVQNSIFSDSWGFCPNTKDDVLFYLDLTGSRIEHVFVAMHNDEVAGYLWPHPVDISRPGKVRIHMLGINPRFRGQGLGRSLLLFFLAKLRAEGFEQVELTVDSENTAARRLYLSLGFQLNSRLIWYEKRISEKSI
jgi:mycothiol synthase